MNFTGERLTTSVNNVTMLEHLHRYAITLEYVKDKIVLDIASGEGYGTNILSTHATKVYGIDISPEAIEFSKKKYAKPNMSFITASAIHIPLNDNSIDVIVSFETIEHHDKHDEMLIEFKRVLKPDGLLIISSPDKLNYSDVPGYNNPFHVKELYRKEFEDLICKYFGKVQFLYQRAFNASFITPLDKTNEIAEFKGDYESITNKGNMAYIYNIAIASDIYLKPLKSSFFEADETFIDNSYRDLAEKYTNSATWKIGRVVGAPLFLMKAVFNKLLK